MPSSQDTPMMSAAAQTLPAESAPKAPWRWRTGAEAVVIPTCAVVAALILFGIFCEFQGRNALKVYAAIYKAAYGNWYSFQNTLLRAAPLMLTALCTALPARLGLIVIGNEGALVVGGVTATASAKAATPWGPRDARTTSDRYWVSVTSSPTSASDRAAIATNTRLAVTTASRIDSPAGGLGDPITCIH